MRPRPDAGNGRPKSDGITGTAARRAQQTADVLAEYRARSARHLSDRLGRLRASRMLIVQSGIAAGGAWYVAHNLLGHPAPFFAPASAVIVLGVTVGQRWRRAFELMLGVAVGIGVGDLLVRWIGRGAWQVALVVVLAVTLAVFLGGSGTIVGQAASTSVIVTTVPIHGLYATRFIDALTGGAVALVVMALLLPLNPLTAVQKAARKPLELLAKELRHSADALDHGDVNAAGESLVRLRATDPMLTTLDNSLVVATETASLAPVRWRSRAPLAQYVDAAVYVGRAVRNGRVLARRGLSATEDEQPVPEAVGQSVRTLAEAVDLLRTDLAEGVEPRRARTKALVAAAGSAEAYRAGVGFSTSVVVAQVRTIATDVLRASGMDYQTTNRAMRAAVGSRRH